jgi:hypothetical protein
LKVFSLPKVHSASHLSLPFCHPTDTFTHTVLLLQQ